MTKRAALHFKVTSLNRLAAVIWRYFKRQSVSIFLQERRSTVIGGIR
jgi:hypothetical protein